jgi:hypothetical protein
VLRCGSLQVHLLAFIALLVVLSAHGSPGHCATGQLSLTGIPCGDPAAGSDAGIPMAGSRRHSGAAAGRQGCCTPELKRWLHREGQRKALIIRSGRYGIHPEFQILIGRLAAASVADPTIGRFLTVNLQKTYISDDQLITEKLESAGYEVVHRFSKDFAQGVDFKQAVLKDLRDPRTALVCVYGHGDHMGFELSDTREHALPGLEEIANHVRGTGGQQLSLSCQEMIEACKEKQLDALILHGCRGGMLPYLTERAGYKNPTYLQCIKAGSGFFAGWVTFSVYLNPRTDEILDAYFCHAAALMAKDTPPEGSNRYYIRSAPGVARRLTRLAGLDDVASLEREHPQTKAKLDLKQVDADTTVHTHEFSEVTGHAGVSAWIDFAYAVRCGTASLRADLQEFLVRYLHYARAAGIPTAVGSAPAPRLPDRPTTEQLNEFVKYYGDTVLRQALQAFVPDMAHINDFSLRFNDNDPDRIWLSLSGEIRNGTHVQQLVRLVRSIYEDPLKQLVDSSVPGGLGPQFGLRLKEGLDRAVASFPDNVLSGWLDLSLTKSVQPGGNRIVPVISGSSLSIGKVPVARQHSRKSPHEVHIALAALNGILKATLMATLGRETKIDTSAIGLPRGLYVRLVDVENIAPYLNWFGTVFASLDPEHRLASVALDTSLSWELRVDWGGPIGSRYGYVDTAIRAIVTPEKSRLKVDPYVTVRLRDGWPLPEFMKNSFANDLGRLVTNLLKTQLANGFDIGALIPVPGPGRLQIRALAVDKDSLDIYLVVP